MNAKNIMKKTFLIINFDHNSFSCHQIFLLTVLFTCLEFPLHMFVISLRTHCESVCAKRKDSFFVILFFFPLLFFLRLPIISFTQKSVLEHTYGNPICKRARVYECIRIARARVHASQLHAHRFSNINDRCWPIATNSLLASD